MPLWFGSGFPSKDIRGWASRLARLWSDSLHALHREVIRVREISEFHLPSCEASRLKISEYFSYKTRFESPQILFFASLKSAAHHQRPFLSIDRLTEDENAGNPAILVIDYESDQWVREPMTSSFSHVLFNVTARHILAT